jgi:hypothetical protein
VSRLSSLLITESPALMTGHSNSTNRPGPRPSQSDSGDGLIALRTGTGWYFECPTSHAGHASVSPAGRLRQVSRAANQATLAGQSPRTEVQGAPSTYNATHCFIVPSGLRAWSVNHQRFWLAGAIRPIAAWPYQRPIHRPAAPRGVVC